MSHFAVMVVTKKAPTRESISEALQPYHEYECTGINDKFVQDIDITDQVRAAMADGEFKTLESALIDYGLENRIVSDESEVEKTGNGTHKYGYAVVKEGQLIKAIDRTNPNKKWDWWEIGGRWSGRLLNKSGEACDFLRKSDLDLELLQQKAIEGAAKRYDAAHDIIDGRPIPKWSEIRDAHEIEEARKIYQSDPVIKDFREIIDSFGDVEEFAVSRETYLENARKNALGIFAVVIGGKWFGRGEMGWWGCVFDEKADWLDIFNKILSEIPDNFWLTVVDCHR